MTKRLFDYDEEDFDLAVLYGPDDIEIHGFFSLGRINENTMPAGKHAYDTRESDMGGEIGTIERGTVSVNFGGVFICDEEIDFGEDDYIDVSDEDGDWSFSFE